MDNSEWYAKLKALHLCKDCKKQDAYTLSGRTYCYECAEKRRIKQAQDRKNPDKLAKTREASMKYKEKCRQEGRCTCCGKPVGSGRRLCPTCLEKNRRWWKQYRGLNPRKLGVICWQCNKNPCVDGHKLCADCYAKQLKIARENLKNVDRENHPWREQNLKLSPKSE